MAIEKLANEIIDENDEIPFSFQQKCFNKLFILILFLTHSLYSLFTFLYSLLNYFYKYLLKCWIFCMSSETVTGSSDKVKMFSKLPHHLAIIVGSEQISYTDLVKLILWCLSIEISHISFYNTKNEISPHLLYKAVSHQSKDSLLRIKWGNSFSEDIKQMAKKSINGYKWQPKLQVNVYNASSGVDCLIEITKYFCQEGAHFSKIDVPTVNKKIQEHMCIPDPDLAIVFSKVMSTFGFLPWHLRVTEIQIIPTHHDLNLHSFLKALESYANCEQRYGK